MVLVRSQQSVYSSQGRDNADSRRFFDTKLANLPRSAGIARLSTRPVALLSREMVGESNPEQPPITIYGEDYA